MTPTRTRSCWKDVQSERYKAAGAHEVGACKHNDTLTKVLSLIAGEPQQVRESEPRLMTPSSDDSSDDDIEAMMIAGLSSKERR
jgi:hypothetical protein